MPSFSSLHQVRAGLIGAGFIGPVHLEALQRLGIRVTAVCDFDAAKAQAVAQKWGVPAVFAQNEYRRLIESAEVDVVHVTSPNRYHFEMVLAALEAGKSCICEKPLAMDTRETAAILKQARKASGRFAVNYNIRFYPAVLQLRAAVARGDLGRIIHVNGSYFQDWLLKETDYNWRLLPEEGGALRAVADIGTHWMDTVSFILGDRIAEVWAHLETFHKTRQRPLGEVQTFTHTASKQKYQDYPVKTEDFASVLLRFAHGVHGNLAVSQVAAGRKNCLRLELYGTKKSAWWDAEEPNVIHYGSRDGAGEISTRNTPGFGADVVGFTDYPAGHTEGFPDTFKMLFRNFYQTLAGVGGVLPLFATAEDGHEEVRVCEAILKSQRTGRWVKV